MCVSLVGEFERVPGGPGQEEYWTTNTEITPHCFQRPIAELIKKKHRIFYIHPLKSDKAFPTYCYFIGSTKTR